MINEKQIDKTLAKLKKLEEIYTSLIFEKVGDVSVNYMETSEHLYRVPSENSSWKQANIGLKWGKEWSSAWFKGTYEIPDFLRGKKLFVSAQTDAVETLFWVNGKPKGIFTHAIEAENRGNHHTLLLTGDAEAGISYELAFESYAGHPCVGTQPYENFQLNDDYNKPYERLFKSIDIMTCREDVKSFVFDLRTLNQLASSEMVDDFRRGSIVNGLLEIFTLLIQSPEEVPEPIWQTGIMKASKIMKLLLAKKNADSAPKAGLIGHSHMDTAWLWTIDETIRKCARTYSNVLSLMDQYPEYTFIQSSAYHAELMRRHYPDIFEGMKDRILEGRWEPNGGVWIESDCNLVSGESLVRQFLKGQSYTRKHFGYTADTFWLPDTFGYSAAIPQILAGVHVKYFLTTKLSWNDTNQFPYETFVWRGIDGTSVLTHFNTTHSWPDAESIINRVYGASKKKDVNQNNIQHKQVNDSRLIAYGFGDGGGGPQYDMLEAARRLQDVEGAPKSEHTTVSKFMHNLAETVVNPPLYVGELYFEGHRGTLTQMHQIKRNNRKAEFAMRNLEFAQVWSWINELGVPSIRKDEIYEILLINQFHDILPGTSLPEVHDRAISEVNEVIREAEEMTAAIMSKVVKSQANKITLWNTLSWARTGTLALTGCESGLIPADSSLMSQRIIDVFGQEKLLISGIEIPAMGVHTITLIPGLLKEVTSPFEWNGNRLETPFAIVLFDEFGYIASFTDKASNRELRGNGYPLNALLMGEDLPDTWDNWDIDRDVYGKLKLQTKLMNREVVTNGSLQLRLRSHYQIGIHSSLKQDIVFHANTPRVDFETMIDWKEKHQLLKVGFDVKILSHSARHETQFGHVERPTHTNTGYDQSMFEVCTHKWTDFSENRFGVALLNDCKYGISVEGSDIRLTLHKGGTHPDPRGDQGIHEMIYSFLPHQGGFSTEAVIRPAYELNVQPLVIVGSPASEIGSLLVIDAPNVILEAIKPAEENQAYVVRLYEAERSAVKRAKLKFDIAPKRVTLVNMLEEEISELMIDNKEIILDFHAFEIKTIKVFF
jgi:alpha-mannosidase